MLTNLLMSLGLTRDSGVWFWGRVVAIAALVSSGAIDLPWIGDYLGVHISETAIHWITAICVVVLWFSGKFDASPLPGAKK